MYKVLAAKDVFALQPQQHELSSVLVPLGTIFCKMI